MFRQDFPFFTHNPKLLYADSAATSQKLEAVVSATERFLRHDNATVHRAAYELANNATAAYERTRMVTAKLINSQSTQQIVFTKGATESLNLVAAGLSRDVLQGDEIIVCGSEHHANFLPWQRLAAQLSMRFRVFHLSASGCLDCEALLDTISDNTALVAIAHVSNALGNVYPVEQICQKSRQCTAISVIDGTQAVPHIRVDVQAMGCDFYAFSGHKMFAATGTGVLYGRQERLAQLAPYQLGGEMVSYASDTECRFQPVPYRFEAGTPNIVGVIGLGHAADYLQQNMDDIQAYEGHLAKVLFRQLSEIDGLTLLGDFSKGRSVIPLASFNVEHIHANDLATLLCQRHIALRHGHHCAMPLMRQLQQQGTLRVSFALYNTEEEIALLCRHIQDCVQQLTSQKSVMTDPQVEHTTQNQSDTLVLAQRIAQANGWDNVLRAVMLAGKSLIQLEPAQRNDNNWVAGCEADVWLMHDFSTEQSSKAMIWKAFSPSKIVRGLLAITVEKANTLSMQQLQKFDFEAYFSEIGLTQFLSESRRSGLQSVFATIKRHALQHSTV